MVLSMDRWVDKVAVVTNAGSRIGVAVAEKLIKEGLTVVGFVRKMEQVEQLTEKLFDKKENLNPEKIGTCYALKVDLNNEKDIARAFKWTKRKVGPIHVLVNNAGVHVRENAVEEGSPTSQKTLDVNVNSLCVATREAIKIMRSNDIDGHVVHVNTIVGHRVSISNAKEIYPATMQALAALTDSLRKELNSLEPQIKISSINPGCVDTPPFCLETQKSELLQHLTEENLLESEDIADAVVYVLSTPAHVQVN
ncbi:hypothetical protein NQ318_016786 [Aromia moschata]|uniref:Farnesol dehydrogenase-like n=1 Tax=Aromia moschata TaxID=1265417 RepID=A0AAV8Y3D7_9CUCU|nr:hypothetical protein NQ318_016786 [Aromia moschata]